jgi:hypothetical protein
MFCLRWLFLRMDVNTSLSLMSPHLLSTKTVQGNHNQLHPASSDTLALYTDAFVVGDLFNKVVVWRGRSANASNAPEVALSHYMSHVNNTRFPTPTLIRCTEGSSMARIISSRLNPLHQDTLKDQCQSQPILSEVPQEVREELYRRFPKTDTPSVNQWLRRAVG